MPPLPSLIKCQPYQGWPAGGPWENFGRRFNSVFLKFMCKFYILDKQPSKEFICIVHKFPSVHNMNSVINDLGYYPFSGVYFSVETPAEQPHTINDEKRLFKSAGEKKTHIFSSLCTTLCKNTQPPLQSDSLDLHMLEEGKNETSSPCSGLAGLSMNP